VVARIENLITFKVLHADDESPVTGAPVEVGITQQNAGNDPNPLSGRPATDLALRGETDEFGNFGFRTNFSKGGLFRLEATLLPITADTAAKKVKLGFSIRVQPPNNSSYKLAVMLVILAGITLVGVFLIKHKTRAPADTRIDLLASPVIKRFFKGRLFQPLIQVFCLLILCVLIFLAFFDLQDSGRNLSLIVIWTIWWAGIIFTFVLVGRLWCYGCPVGAVSEWVSRWSKPQRSYPGHLRNMWIANGLFVLLTWLDIQIGVVRNPVVTGILLTGVLAGAAVIGFFISGEPFADTCARLAVLSGCIHCFHP